MEHHDGVYGQMMDMNNANQGTEYISHQIVQEIVVQNDNAQQSSVNCGMPGIEMMLSNDCINVQDQCHNNLILGNNMNQYTNEKPIENQMPHINNVEENITYTPSHTEQKVEQFIIQNPDTYQEPFEPNNTVLISNSENDNKDVDSENRLSNNVSVAGSKTDLVSGVVDNDNAINDSNNIIENINEPTSKQELENITSLKENVISSSTVSQDIESMNVDNIVTFTKNIDQNTIIESYNPSQNQSMDIPESKYPNDIEVDSKSSLEMIKSEYTEKESVKETKIISNPENIVLTQYESVEYHANLEVPQKDDKSEESLQKTEYNKKLPIEVSEKSEKSTDSETQKTNMDSTDISSSAEIVEEVKNSDQELPQENMDEDDIELNLSSQSSDSHRKVIQDIFDDWQEENAEDDTQTEHQDSVELELQNLLNDEAQVTSSVSYISGAALDEALTTASNKNYESTPVKQKNFKSEKSSSSSKRSSNGSPKSSKGSSSNYSKSQDQSEQKQKFQSPRPGVKIPSHHLTSQIASKDEVTEVLKERLKEKQKDLSTPKTADLVFVKKITARLSSKLSGAIAANLSSMIPIPSNEDKAKLDKSVESTKTSATDNKELLAILEGDDDDWTDLKGSTEESNRTLSPAESGSKTPSNLERELALKQLQELPTLPKKGSPGATKKIKSSKSQKPEDKSKSKSSDSKVKTETTSSADSAEENSQKEPKSRKENTKENIENDTVEHNVDESRSGRKRKPTEKAREHELSVKRLKSTKIKTADNKKKESSQEPAEAITEEDSKLTSSKPDEVKVETKVNKPESSKLHDKESEPTKLESNSDDESIPEVKMPSIKKSAKQLGISKKDGAIAKRKLAVKNILRQKKNITKSKIQTEPLNKESSSKTSAEKQTASGTPNRPKKPSEIDKLLQDEGIVNMLYEAEAPDNRRLVPITKSQKKVMDVDKAERELKLRTKLVRNAVMRLRNTSDSIIKISPRTKRNILPPKQSSPQADKKSKEPARSPKVSTSTAPPDFTLPEKIQRNAADASRIIRRHSSSSFSSASASPRVSVDMPPESVRLELLDIQSKIKRKNSLNPEEKSEKKSKNKSIAKMESDDDTESTSKETIKKLKPRSIACRLVPKYNKVPKSRSSLDSNSGETKSPEVVTACLAEAATALSTFSSRSNASANRKKGSLNSSKVDDEKIDIKKLFGFKEINVKYHGHLVQLTLTPSASSSGIRNSITIQIMKELREALLILTKVEDCRVVLLTSTGTSFCEGLEISSLLSSNKEERKRRAEEMATTVKAFLKTLAAFKKPIVAGVQGTAIGLGVTMLPLFDLVIASDKATFSTPYAKLGQIAEGTAVLTLSHSLGTAVINELLLGGRILTASEALRAGLVTRVLWPDRFSSELLPSLKSMSEQSSQSMEATKSILRRSLREQLEFELETESQQLIEHWCSTECQKAIEVYIEERGQ